MLICSSSSCRAAAALSGGISQNLYFVIYRLEKIGIRPQSYSKHHTISSPRKQVFSTPKFAGVVNFHTSELSFATILTEKWWKTGVSPLSVHLLDEINCKSRCEKVPPGLPPAASIRPLRPFCFRGNEAIENMEENRMLQELGEVT